MRSETSSDTHSKEDITYFKLPLNSKEIIKNVALKAENRLREEQKSVKNQKRIVRVQELMSSEEEKRKTKQKAVLICSNSTNDSNSVIVSVLFSETRS